MENFLKKVKKEEKNLATLNSDDLESEIFREDLHDLNESIELYDENLKKMK